MEFEKADGSVLTRNKTGSLRDIIVMMEIGDVFVMKDVDQIGITQITAYNAASQLGFKIKTGTDFTNKVLEIKRIA